jgi:hypothetical protein
MELYEKERTLDKSERYIHSVIATAEHNLIVTFDPHLVTLIHVARTLEVDTTYERNVSSMKEWEITIWLASLNRRKHSIPLIQRHFYGY